MSVISSNIIIDRRVNNIVYMNWSNQINIDIDINRDGGRDARGKVYHLSVNAFRRTRFGNDPQRKNRCHLAKRCLGYPEGNGNNNKVGAGAE